MAKDSGVFFANRPIRYVTKDDLMFQGLARSSGKEIVRLRFSRPYGAELESRYKLAKRAYRPVSGGHTTVGVTAYVGSDATQSEIGQGDSQTRAGG